MAEWRDNVVGTATELIARANQGAFPMTEADWENVADRLCVGLVVGRCRSRYSGVRVDDVLAIKRHEDDSITLRRILHEFVEYLLTSEWSSPYCYVGDCAAYECHRIACTIERFR